jgi:hypothetical protein
VLLVGAAGVKADSLSFSTYDTLGAGSVTANPDGSFRLQTFTSADKASVVFGKGYNVVLGALGNVTHFSADLLKHAPTANPADLLAVRLWTNAGGTEGLVWENNYNGNADVNSPLDTWMTLNFTNGLFWERANSYNFAQISNLNTLTNYKDGFTPTTTLDGGHTGVTFNSSTPVYAIQVSYGSGIGAFDGSVNHVNLDFKTASFTSDSPAAAVGTPLPSTALGGLACFGILGGSTLFRRRKVVA